MNRYKRLRGFVLLVPFLLITADAFAQRQANFWHFGFQGGYDFSTGTPLPIVSAQNTFEGAASYCDPVGNLLFYTNGGGKDPAVVPATDPGTIWNRNNGVMHNMNGVQGGGWSAQQSSVIFEAPGEDSVYYLFTMEETEWDQGASAATIAAQPGGRGLSYFKIDMRLNGGLGAVTVQDQRVFTPSYEGLCAVRHANQRDYWVIINMDTIGLGIYSVTPSGVSLAGTYTALGPSFLDPLTSYPSSIKGSPDGTKLLATFYGHNGNTQSLYLLKFDNLSGQINDSLLIKASPDGLSNLSLSYEFSPNSQYVFSSRIDALGAFPLPQKIVRYDVTVPNPGTTETTVDSFSIAGIFQGLQLAPDGKIYFVEGGNGSTEIHRILCPNTLNPSVQYLFDSHPSTFQNFPNFPAWLFENYDSTFVSLGPDSVRICDVGGSYVLNALNPGATFLWSTGETTQSITVTNPGTYSVTVNGPCGTGSDELVVIDCAVIASPSCDSLISEESLTICAGDTIQLQANLSAYASVSGIQWSGGNGVFIPSDTVASPLYVPTQAEISSGALNLFVEVNATIVDTTNPGRLIAYDHESQDLVFEISTIDGSIDSIQDNVGNDWVGAGYDVSNGLLYGISAFSSFSSINLQNGNTTNIGNFITEQFYSGEFDNVNGRFYSVGNIPSPTGAPVNQFLCTINTSTAAVNLIGSLNLFTSNNFYTGSDDGINGLAYDPGLDVLYGVSANGKLFRINVNNAAVTFVGTTQADLRGLAYDPVSGKLWGVSNNATLYEIDKSSGTVLASVNCQVPFSFVTSLTYVSGAVPQNIVCQDTVAIAIRPVPIAAVVSPADACEGSSFAFSLSTNGTINSLTWNFGNPGSGSSNTSAQLNPNYVYNTPGTYTVSVAANLECLVDTLSSLVTVLPVPTVTAQADGFTIQPGESVELSASGADVYLWSPTDGLSCSTCPVTTASPLTTTTYFVNGAFAAGCAESDSVTITVELICKELFVPDIFSPNGTGNPENEKFCVYSNCIKSMELGVYNRWGELIFITSNPNDCWDGTHKGAPVTPGVYTYRLFVEQADGKIIEKSGSLTLSR